MVLGFSLGTWKIGRKTGEESKLRWKNQSLVWMFRMPIRHESGDRRGLSPICLE